MKVSMDGGKSPDTQVVDARGRLADLSPRSQIHWLDLAQQSDSGTNTDEAYDNAACSVAEADSSCSDPETTTSLSDGQLDQDEKFFSAMDLDEGGERRGGIEMSPIGSDQNLIEDERQDVRGNQQLELSPSGSDRSRDVLFADKPIDITTPKSMIRDGTDITTQISSKDIRASMASQGVNDRKSFENKSFTNDWQTEEKEAIHQTETRGQNGTARFADDVSGTVIASSNHLDGNSNVNHRLEAKDAGKSGATNGVGSGGKRPAETGFHRISLRRILRHFSERRERSAVQRERRLFNAAPCASNLQPSIVLPSSALASRRQSEGDAHADSAACRRRTSSLHAVNGVSVKDRKQWKLDVVVKTNGHLDAAGAIITPRRSSVTITTHFGDVDDDGRAKTDCWMNGHMNAIPSISRDIGADDVARRIAAGSTVVEIVDGGGNVEGGADAAGVGEVQPAMIEDTGESFFRILLETIFPFIMAGFGCAFAGIVLDIVQHWQVFLEVGEIFILVPSLLGLKGNLEMTQASRLSTQANLGHMETTTEQLKLIGASLALTQVQSIVVAFMASIVAILLGWIPAGKFDLLHGILVCTSSVITASIASLVLGSVMVGVVLISRKFHINPDNVATPFGGSLGDLTTISLLSSIAMLLFNVMESHVWVAPALLCFWLCLTPVWWTIANRHSYTRNVLRTGWVPVIGAMAISSVGGLVLDMAVEHFEGIAVFQPVVNGVGGNLVAVQASRLATALHRICVPGVLPVNAVHCCPNVFTTFFGKGTGSKTARVLMLMVIPGHIIFMFTIEYLKNGCSTLTPTFVVVYVTATVIQVATLLYVANFLVHWLWSRGNDPDNYSIPYLTAIGDLLGGLLLVAAFSMLTAIGDINTEPKIG